MAAASWRAVRTSDPPCRSRPDQPSHSHQPEGHDEETTQSHRPQNHSKQGRNRGADCGPGVARGIGDELGRDTEGPVHQFGRDDGDCYQAAIPSRQCDHARRCQAAPTQTAHQGRATCREPALDRPQRPAQRPCRRLVSEALDQAEIDGQPLVRRKSVDFRIDHRGKFPASRFRGGSAIDRCGHDSLACRDDSRFAFLPPQSRRPRPAGHPVRDPIEPGGHRIPVPEGACLAHQDQKRRLERVLDVLGLLEPAPTDRQDHRPVTRDQLSKRRLVAKGDEAVQ